MDRGLSKNFIFLLGWAACVLIFSYLLLRIGWYPVQAPLFEGILCLTVVVGMFSFESVREIFEHLPKGLKIATVVFILLMSVGQIVSISRLTFPFVPWNMFSRNVFHSEIMFFEYVGTTEDGQKVSIRPPEMFMSLASGRLVTDIDNRIKYILKHKPSATVTDTKSDEDNEAPDGQPDMKHQFIGKVRTALHPEIKLTWENQEHELDAVLKAVGTMYNRRFTTRPIAGIDVVKKSLHWDGAPDYPVTQEIVWHVDLPKEVKP